MATSFPRVRGKKTPNLRRINRDCGPGFAWYVMFCKLFIRASLSEMGKALLQQREAEWYGCQEEIFTGFH